MSYHLKKSLFSNPKNPQGKQVEKGSQNANRNSTNLTSKDINLRKTLKYEQVNKILNKKKTTPKNLNQSALGNTTFSFNYNVKTYSY